MHSQQLFFGHIFDRNRARETGGGGHINYVNVFTYSRAVPGSIPIPAQDHRTVTDPSNITFQSTVHFTLLVMVRAVDRSNYQAKGTDSDI